MTHIAPKRHCFARESRDPRTPLERTLNARACLSNPKRGTAHPLRNSLHSRLKRALTIQTNRSIR
eukprot:5872300-Pleurochrysis_carterae.AAC.1